MTSPVSPFAFLSRRRLVDSHIFNPGYALIDQLMLPANRDIREAGGKLINDNGISVLARVTSTSGCSTVLSPITLSKPRTNFTVFC
jgi:hypothetical protein